MKTTESAGQDNPLPNIPNVRCVFITGFVGAGKTTAADQLAEYLHKKGLRVGLITNDHGNELVDTSIFRANNYLTDEIRGGCFSNQIGAFIETANAFVERNNLNLLIAEPT